MRAIGSCPSRCAYAFAGALTPLLSIRRGRGDPSLFADCDQAAQATCDPTGSLGGLVMASGGHYWQGVRGTSGDMLGATGTTAVASTHRKLAIHTYNPLPKPMIGALRPSLNHQGFAASEVIPWGRASADRKAACGQWWRRYQRTAKAQTGLADQHNDRRAHPTIPMAESRAPTPGGDARRALPGDTGNSQITRPSSQKAQAAHDPRDPHMGFGVDLDAPSDHDPFRQSRNGHKSPHTTVVCAVGRAH